MFNKTSTYKHYTDNLISEAQATHFRPPLCHPTSTADLGLANDLDINAGLFLAPGGQLCGIDLDARIVTFCSGGGAGKGASVPSAAPSDGTTVAEGSGGSRSVGGGVGGADGGSNAGRDGVAGGDGADGEVSGGGGGCSRGGGGSGTT